MRTSTRKRDLRLDPTEEQGPGTYNITFRVTDNGSPACTDSEVVVTVQEVGGENQCPVLGPIGDRTVNESVLLTFTATATDTDIGQTLTYSLSTNAPTGATLDPSTGLFNWTPTEDQSPGVYPITIRVFDTGSRVRGLETINVTVNEVGDNICPELAQIEDRSVDELSLLKRSRPPRPIGRGPDPHLHARSGVPGGCLDRSEHGRVHVHPGRGSGSWLAPAHDPRHRQRRSGVQ